jgi:hypothetical protein
LAALSSAVVCGFSCTTAGNGSAMVRTLAKLTGLTSGLTFCEMVYGTCCPSRFEADAAMGKYVMPYPVRRMVRPSSESR